MKKFIQSFGYALNGIKHAYKGERNMIIHLLAALCVVLLGSYLQVSTAEWLWLTACIGMVMVAEMFNTAVEKLVDMVSPHHDERAGLIKDLAAGAVLVTAITAAVIGLVIFIPKLV